MLRANWVASKARYAIYVYMVSSTTLCRPAFLLPLSRWLVE